MIKEVTIPAILFVLSAFSSLMAIPLAGLSLVVGIVICGNATLKHKTRNRMDSKSTTNGSLINNFLFRSGFVLIIVPIITITLVITGMSGLFGKL
jgi:uncharacterized membrane protein